MTFREFCADHGINCPLDLEPGKWVRCSTVEHPRKKNASVKLADDGKVGWVHDFSTMSAPALWKCNGDGPEIRPFSNLEIRQREAERLRLMREATAAAQRFYSKCQPLNGHHAYLESKELTTHGCDGIRQGSAGELVIPMRRHGEIVSVQKINADGSKKFWYGAPSKGTSHSIMRRHSPITIFCEGVATGLTLFAAIPESTVICTFSAGNMAIVAKAMRPKGIVIIASDNDYETEERIGKNPGRIAAEEAALATGGGIAIPDACGTDWNDFFTEAMQRNRDDNALSKYKKQPGMIRANALAEVKHAVMKAAKFVAHP